MWLTLSLSLSLSHSLTLLDFVRSHTGCLMDIFPIRLMLKNVWFVAFKKTKNEQKTCRGWQIIKTVSNKQFGSNEIHNFAHVHDSLIAFSLSLFIGHTLTQDRCYPVWPDVAIYCTFGNFLKPVATIILPKLPTFKVNFGISVKIFHFSSEIIFGQLL